MVQWTQKYGKNVSQLFHGERGQTTSLLLKVVVKRYWFIKYAFIFLRCIAYTFNNAYPVSLIFRQYTRVL